MFDFGNIKLLYSLGQLDIEKVVFMILGILLAIPFTKDIVELFETLENASGESRILKRLTYTFDGTTYDPFKEGEPFAEFKTLMADPAQNRTLTITFDPNTADEFINEYTLPYQTRFRVFREEGQVISFYTDRECTQMFESSDGVTDLELYVKKAE